MKPVLSLKDLARAFLFQQSAGRKEPVEIHDADTKEPQEATWQEKI
jgi:hypothetical protein